MEVWALEAYGAAHTLQEMFTIKSDDVVVVPRPTRHREGREDPSSIHTGILQRAGQRTPRAVSESRSSQVCRRSASRSTCGGQTQEGAAELVRLKTRFDEEVETEDLIRQRIKSAI